MCCRMLLLVVVMVMLIQLVQKEGAVTERQRERERQSAIVKCIFLCLKCGFVIDDTASICCRFCPVRKSEKYQVWWQWVQNVAHVSFFLSVLPLHSWLVGNCYYVEPKLSGAATE